MNKSASSILMMIFEVIVVVMVIGMALTVSNKFANSKTVTKINLAEDILMFVNTFVGVPGDAIVELNYDGSELILILSSNKITIMEEGEQKEKWIERDIILPEGYQLSGDPLKNEEDICLEKEGHNIQLRVCDPKEVARNYFSVFGGGEEGSVGGGGAGDSY